MRDMLLTESDTIELKESWTEDAMADLAAFANTRGGTLYVGVKDSGEIRGCDVSDDAQKRIGAKILNILQIGADIRIVTGDAAAGLRQALAISVKPSRSPILLRGSYWTRVGTISTKATPEQWANLVLEQTGRTWDSLPVRDGVGLEAIDASAIADYIREAKAHSEPRLPVDLPDNAPIEVVLGSLGLLPNGQVSNAAILAFGKAPYEMFRNARIRIARFRGSGVNDIREHRPQTGTALRQIDGAIEVLEQYIPVRFLMPGTSGNLDETVRRRDLAEYPVSVVREAVTNCVIHRDYVSSDDIQIRVFDDRFEIWNPGGLMPGITIEDLYKTPHLSKRRNPLLADVAFFVHDIERWGSGTSRMVRACKAAAVPLPEFKEQAGGFTVILRRDAWTDEVLQALGLNERQLQAIPELRTNGFLTAQVYQRITGASRRTAFRDLEEMRRLGLIEQAGAGRYVLKRSVE